jgi:hypothetical protein
LVSLAFVGAIATSVDCRLLDLGVTCLPDRPAEDDDGDTSPIGRDGTTGEDDDSDTIATTAVPFATSTLAATATLDDDSPDGTSPKLFPTFFFGFFVGDDSGDPTAAAADSPTGSSLIRTLTAFFALVGVLGLTVSVSVVVTVAATTPPGPTVADISVSTIWVVVDSGSFSGSCTTTDFFEG